MRFNRWCSGATLATLAVAVAATSVTPASADNAPAGCGHGIGYHERVVVTEHNNGAWFDTSGNVTKLTGHISKDLHSVTWNPLSDSDHVACIAIQLLGSSHFQVKTTTWPWKRTYAGKVHVLAVYGVGPGPDNHVGERPAADGHVRSCATTRPVKWQRHDNPKDYQPPHNSRCNGSYVGQNPDASPDVGTGVSSYWSAWPVMAPYYSYGPMTFCSGALSVSYSQSLICSRAVAVSSGMSGGLGGGTGLISATVGFDVTYSTTITAGDSVVVPAYTPGELDYAVKYYTQDAMQELFYVSPSEGDVPSGIYTYNAAWKVVGPVFQFVAY